MKLRRIWAKRDEALLGCFGRVAAMSVRGELDGRVCSCGEEWVPTETGVI